MGWIKRNLFFVVGGLLTLGLLGGAGFYIYKGWSSNSDASSTLNELYAKLTQINQEPQQPGNDKIDNVATAKDQEQQMRNWVKQAVGYFQPIQPIPQGDVTSKTFAAALNTTINQLQQEAKQNSVSLPIQYYFSFQAQSSKLTISSGLGPLAEQLGQVKAVAEILFGARVNDLIGIQRVRVSDDDAASGSQSDYIDERPVTNDLAIITPYVVTFQTFTPELARAISGFATSTNPFIVKSITVQPASSSGMPGDMGNGAPPQMMDNPGRYGPPGRFGPAMDPRYQTMPPPGYPPGQPSPGTPPPAGKGGLQTVLKEQLLRITLEVEIVKLLPKS
jgi:hypothetical protein